jgi:hypothetical protein
MDAATAVSSVGKKVTYYRLHYKPIQIRSSQNKNEFLYPDLLYSIGSYSVFRNVSN